MAVKKHKRLNKKLTKKQIAAAVCIALAIAVCIAAVIGAFCKKEPIYYDFGKAQAKGYDLSEHNGDIDWDKLCEEVDFVFIRVGYRGYGSGKICEDKNARKNIKAAEKAGIPYGVYFYTQAVNQKEAEEEAAFVHRIIKHSSPSLPAVMDFEYPTDENGDKTGRLWEAALTEEESTAVVNAFCDKLRKYGYMSGIYASSSVLYQAMDTSNLLNDCVIWVADYNGSVTYDVDYNIWQYTRTGESECVESQYVDINYFYSKLQKN